MNGVRKIIRCRAIDMLRKHAVAVTLEVVLNVLSEDDTL